MNKRTELKTYASYPESVKKNAKTGILLNARVNNKCATQVGKVRAQALADGKGVSLEVVKRMYSYLSRASEYYNPKDTKACGTISYLLWGGKPALSWAKKILREEGEIEASAFADIGPRGGIRPSKKAPRSKTPEPNPKSGSKKNPEGSAKKPSGVKVPKEVEGSLRKKTDDFNERYKKKLGYGVTIGMLKTVYQRGVGAFQTSHSPNVKSSEQWAQARVNAFLYLVKNGRPQNKKYVGDNDILPKGHPKKS